MSAGLDVGFSVLLMAAMWTAAEGKLSTPVVRILIGNMYAIGFVFVVLGRSELFTEQTTLAVLPVLAAGRQIGSLDPAVGGGAFFKSDRTRGLCVDGDNHWPGTAGDRSESVWGAGDQDDGSFQKVIS